MPSSMIFTGLVALWLIVLVPTIARRRQEVERPSVAALSGRVLARPQRDHGVEVGRMTVHEDVRTVQDVGLGAGSTAASARVPAARTGEEPVTSGPGRPADHADGPASPDERFTPDDSDEVDGAQAAEGADDREWERPPPRYRPGRGGFDAEAALATARARYAFRQRVVLALLVGAVVTGVMAAVSVQAVWWVHGALDLLLVGYLCYLRRQVRMEDAIRNRRSARLTGSPRTAGAGRAQDAWAGSGRGAAARAAAASDDDTGDDESGGGPEEFTDSEGFDQDDDAGSTVVDGSTLSTDEPEPERVAGTGEPVGPLRALPETVEQKTALPRLLPVPPPPLPAGTALVEADDADLALTDIDLPRRRAAGE